MDRDALETFLAIHREGGFTRAADRLNRSQPAISRRIRVLEQQLDAPLFERTADGPVLSQAGRVLLPHAERALAALRDAEAAVAALGQSGAGPVSLALVGTLAAAEFGRALRAFAGDNPGIDLRLRTATSSEVGALVRRGEALLGLRYGTDPSADLDCRILAHERLMVVCGRDHPLAGRSVADLRDLQGEHWLAFPERSGPEGSGRREIGATHIFALFLAQGLVEIDWTPIDSLTAQKRLVEAGFGLAMMAESAVADELAAGSLDRIAVGGPAAERPIVLVRRREGFLSMAARDLCRCLDRVFADTVP